jgi:hypothetical protein
MIHSFGFMRKDLRVGDMDKQISDQKKAQAKKLGLRG